MKMQIRIVALMSALGVLLALPALSAPHSQDPQPAAQQRPGKAHAPVGQEGEGEKKFKQNCSRCHEAPQGFSPRISGTILRHMRVRASLSQQDERDILRFLNP
jgi:mono/diheme cytochrome c family protein